MHYGFLPHRNSAEHMVLNKPHSGDVTTPLRATWQDVGTENAILRQACRDRLAQYKTTLEQDWEQLRQIQAGPQRMDNHRLEQALQYRINQKTLLSAIARENLTASGASSSFYASAFAFT